MQRLIFAFVLLCGCRSAPFPYPIGGDGGDVVVVDAAVDAGRADMAVAGPGSVRCGSGNCSAPLVCCSGDNGATGTCQGTGSCQAMYRYACDEPGDCPAGSVCCSPPQMGSSCAPRGSCTISARRLCKLKSDCLANENCCSGNFGPGNPTYNYCSSGPCPL